MRNALNSSLVWELTTEGERLFHCGIVRGKMSSSGITVCVVSTILGTVWCPGWFQTVSRGQVLVFFYRHSTRMYFIKEKQGGLIPTGLKSWPLKLVKHLADTTCVSPSPWGTVKKFKLKSDQRRTSPGEFGGESLTKIVRTKMRFSASASQTYTNVYSFIYKARIFLLVDLQTLLL